MNRFLKLTHVLILVLNFLCVYPIQFYHVNQLQAFRRSQFLFFLVKMINHYEARVIFQDIKHQLQENILNNFFH